MSEISGYVFGGLSIITTITISIVTGAIRASNEKKQLIADQAVEKASLKFQCEDLRKIAAEIKEVVKENYSVLGGQLKALQQMMLSSDKFLGERIDKVEDCVFELKGTVKAHSEAIGTLKDNVCEIKRKVG